MINEFHQFGLKFERVTELNYLRILKWRNRKHVRENMNFSNIISRDQHNQWFRSLSQEKDFYFIVSENDNPFGVFNIKNVDWKLKSGETGSYIFKNSFLNSIYGALSGFGLAHLAFEILLLEKLYCYVKKDNKMALNYNLKQGFELNKSFQDKDLVELHTTRDKFFEKSGVLYNKMKNYNASTKTL